MAWVRATAGHEQSGVTNMRVQQFVAIGCVWVCTACSGGGETDIETDVSSQALRGTTSLEEQTITLETGIDMAFVEQGAHGGIPVILLHGYTDSHHSFDRILPRFPRRFHVFALDQRGHGDSSKPACCYTQPDFAADVVAFMDAVGLDRASLVGHAMGSFVAQNVALDFPERVDDLVLISSAPTVVGNPLALQLEPVIDSLTDPIDPAFVRQVQSSLFFSPIPEAFLDTAVAESLKVPASVWQQALDGLLAQDRSAELDQIAAPTLILFGEEDIFFSAAEQAILDNEIPDSTLIIYPETGHGVHVERPREAARDIRRFLR